MTDKQLPAEVQERIKADAKRRAELSQFHPTDGDYSSRQFHEFIVERSYIAGATAVHERAQVLVDGVNKVREIIKGLTAGETHRFPTLEYLDNELKEALQQWKQGKEVGNG